MNESLKTQSAYIKKIRNQKLPVQKKINDLDVICLPKVYHGGTDSQLVIEMMKINQGDEVLDLCCGNGIIGLAATKMGARSVVGTDLNPEAIKNANLNKRKLGIKNLKFIKGDLFASITSKFDVVIINPPYTNKKAKDLTEICFWDQNNSVTKRFFENVRNYLKKDGRAYLAWAEFANQDLIASLAAKNNCTIRLLGSKISQSGFRFDVYLIMVINQQV